MDIHKPCPHCSVPLDRINEDNGARVLIRCRHCRCRWNVFGDLLKWGASCPKLTGKPPPRKRAMNVGASELTRRETAPASAHPQGRLL